MNTRWFLVVLALIGAALACNFPGLSTDVPTSTTEVKSVAVDPASGSGSFTLKVTYDAFVYSVSLSQRISCYYVGPDGWRQGLAASIPHKTVSAERSRPARWRSA